MAGVGQQAPYFQSNLLTALQPINAGLNTPVPLPGPDASRKAKRRSITEQLQRRGRASTILTDEAVGVTTGPVTPDQLGP